VQSGVLVWALHGHTDAVTSLSFSPQGDRLLSGSDDKTAIIWDIATGMLLLRFNGHSAEIKSVRFSPVNARFVTL